MRTHPLFQELDEPLEPEEQTLILSHLDRMVRENLLTEGEQVRLELKKRQLVGLADLPE